MLLLAQTIAWFSITTQLIAAGVHLGKGKAESAVVKCVDATLTLVILGVLMGWWH